MAKRKQTKYIIIHCSDTPPGMDIGAREITKWHKEKGWRTIGYNSVIKRNGLIETGREYEDVGAHVRGKNDVSHGVCVIGGRHGKADFTLLQWKALEAHVQDLVKLYPDAEVVGHNKFSSKECPSFNVEAWWGNF